jgi:hypothetical protein
VSEVTSAPLLDVADLEKLEQVIVGGDGSVKLARKLQDALKPALSLVVQLTFVEPKGKMEHDVGLHVVVTEPELSDAEVEKQYLSSELLFLSSSSAL